MKPSTRRKARFHAVQALYQVLFTGDSANNVIEQHIAEMNQAKVDIEYFKKITQGALNDTDTLDETFKPFLTRALNELTPIELCVLRLATFELIHCLDVPYRVVLNEALDLNKAFGTQEGFKFVNGVLDKVAKKLRENEYRKESSPGERA